MSAPEMEVVRILRALAADKRAVAMAIGSEAEMIPVSDMTALLLADIALDEGAADAIERLSELSEEERDGR